MNKWIMLPVFLLLAFAAGAIGAQFSPGDWYAGLAKPPWTPPDAVFGPVWSVLYVMIAVSGWRVWQLAGWQAPGMHGWFLQLALNSVWSWLFFGLHAPGLAMAGIALLWLAIVAAMLGFRHSSRLAAALLLPYLLWVSYAAALNMAIWLANR